MSVPRRPYILLAALFAALLLLITGCSVAEDRPSATRGAAGPESQLSARTAPVPPAAPAPPAEIPALGPQTRAQLPATARQAFVVTGDAPDSNQSTAVLYTRDDPAEGWRPAAGPWPAHNGLKGWTGRHVAGDLRSISPPSRTAARTSPGPSATCRPRPRSRAGRWRPSSM